MSLEIVLSSLPLNQSSTMAQSVIMKSTYSRIEKWKEDLPIFASQRISPIVMSIPIMLSQKGSTTIQNKSAEPSHEDPGKRRSPSHSAIPLNPRAFVRMIPNVHPRMLLCSIRADIHFTAAWEAAFTLAPYAHYFTESG